MLPRCVQGSILRGPASHGLGAPSAIAGQKHLLIRPDSRPMNVPIDRSYQLFAARYVRKQLKQLNEQLDGIRQEDNIEYIHRARVASRRLRTALRMFRDCFDRKIVKDWRKEVRRLTTGLGEARDRDVQTEFICDVLFGIPDKVYYPGIARLLVKLQLERESLQPRVVKAVDRFEKSSVSSRIGTATKRLADDIDKESAVEPSEFILRQTARHIKSKLEEVLDYESCLADPEDQERHHAMRIAAKAMRYTLEICKPVYGNQLDDFISTAKEVQRLLGDIHDCDVWVEDLDELLKEERQRIIKCFGHEEPLQRLKVGIDYLSNDRKARRCELFEKLVQYWEEVQRIQLWDELVRTVGPQPGQPPVGQPNGNGSSRDPIGREADLPCDQNDNARGKVFTPKKPQAVEPEPTLEQAN